MVNLIDLKQLQDLVGTISITGTQVLRTSEGEFAVEKIDHDGIVVIQKIEAARNKRQNDPIILMEDADTHEISFKIGNRQTYKVVDQINTHLTKAHLNTLRAVVNKVLNPPGSAVVRQTGKTVPDQHPWMDREALNLFVGSKMRITRTQKPYSKLFNLSSSFVQTQSLCLAADSALKPSILSTAQKTYKTLTGKDGDFKQFDDFRTHILRISRSQGDNFCTPTVLQYTDRSTFINTLFDEGFDLRVPPSLSSLPYDFTHGGHFVMPTRQCIGVGAFLDGLGLEERMIYEFTELLAILANHTKMDDRGVFDSLYMMNEEEVFLFSNLRHGIHLNFQGDKLPENWRGKIETGSLQQCDVIALDVTFGSEQLYTVADIFFLLLKTHVGCCAARRAAATSVQSVLWKEHNPLVAFVIQWLAASMAGIEIQFHSVDDATKAAIERLLTTPSFLHACIGNRMPHPVVSVLQALFDLINDPKEHERILGKK